MKKTITALSLLVALFAAVGTGTESAAAGQAIQSASGFGQVHLGLPFRNFAFSATKQLDGGVTGQAQLERSDNGIRAHIDIDCLNVLGNVAVMSGVYTFASDPASVGSDVLFAVQDNGEGPSAPPDQITLAISGLGIPCTYITDPAMLALFFVPIESGQIQVNS
jgi:hypothetical protein